MLDDTDGVGCGELGVAQRGEQGEVIRIAIGRVGEDEIELLAVERGDGARGLGGNNEILLIKTKCSGVAGQTHAGFAAGLDKGNMSSAARKALEAHATRASKQIEDAAAGNPRAENVEQRRAHTIRRRPDIEAGRGSEAAAAEGTGDDADHNDLRFTIYDLGRGISLRATTLRGGRESFALSGQGNSRSLGLKRE